VERRQLKWFTFAGAIEIGFLAVTPFVSLGPLVSVVFALLVPPLLPIAAAIAILRYRLYEIDRIVSRTVSYSIVTALLGGLFVGIVLILQDLLAPLTNGQTVAVATSTLIIATLFQSIRGRVQAVVDRRFNRSRYDAERTAETFATRLRDNVDIARLRTEIRGVVVETVAPMAIEVWIRDDDRRLLRTRAITDAS
jgi:hypothetical protein